jgi:hypothetical protein
MRLASSLLVVSAILACGCSSSGSAAAPRAPLVIVRSCPVTCGGSIGGGRDAQEPVAAPAPAPAPERRFHASVGVARLSQAQAVALLRATPGCADAAVVTSESAERALGGAGGLVPARPFTAGDRETGVVALEQPTSYVDRFEFTESDAAAILDPQIGVYTVGQRLTLKPSLNEAEGSWTLELALRSVDAGRPAVARAQGVLGTDSEVRIDLPLLALVETKTTATLARGESLVVVSPELLRGDSVVVAVVTPER